MFSIEERAKLGKMYRKREIIFDELIHVKQKLGFRMK
jgi:hypothetical protein